MSAKRDKLLINTLKNISKLKWHMVIDGDITEYKSEDGKVVFRTVSAKGRIHKHVLTVNGRYYDSNEYFPEQIYYAIIDTKPTKVQLGKREKSKVKNSITKEEKVRLEKEKERQCGYHCSKWYYY